MRGGGALGWSIANEALRKSGPFCKSSSHAQQCWQYNQQAAVRLRSGILCPGKRKVARKRGALHWYQGPLCARGEVANSSPTLSAYPLYCAEPFRPNL